MRVRCDHANRRVGHADARRGAPRGALMVVVVVALLVMSLLSLTIARTGIQQYRNIRQHQDRVQSQLLAEAGIERAAAALRADTAYRGEVWMVPAEVLRSVHSGEVTIRIEADAEASDRVAVGVTADFPARIPQRHRTSRRVFLSVKRSAELARDVPPPRLPQTVPQAPATEEAPE